MRKKLIAGNWKMHTTWQSGRDLAIDIVDEIGQPSGEREIVIIPPFTHLESIFTILEKLTGDWPEADRIRLGAQNCHWEDEGPYTGEVSAHMLKSVGVEYVIIGHSERREHFNEDDALLHSKLQRVLAQEMHPIFCCGEKETERQQGKHRETVAAQLAKTVFQLDETLFRNVVLAYEPVWAIGTGNTATPEQAQEMHRFIRDQVASHFNKEVADATRIIYGGSCKPDNAAKLFNQADVDGGLVGGASRELESFPAICKV